MCNPGEDRQRLLILLDLTINLTILLMIIPISSVVAAVAIIAILETQTCYRLAQPHCARQNYYPN